MAQGEKDVESCVLKPAFPTISDAQPGRWSDSPLGFARLGRKERTCAYSEPLTPLIKGFARSEGRLGMLKEKEGNRREAL